jgi:arylsulfatase A-like enzyme
VIKPGASIFYFKQTIDKQLISPDAGFAYRYDLNVNPLILRPQGVLLYENGHQLNRSEGNIVVETGKSAYSLGEVSLGSVYVYFSSSDNSNPITNDRKYTLYLPMRFISRTLGYIYLIILIPGLVWFLIFALAIPAHRQTLLQSPQGITIVLDRFFEHISQFVKPGIGSIWQQIKARGEDWKKLFALTILVAYFYIFMEWIFFVTKPSFMSMMSSPEKVEIFIFSGLFFSLLCMLVIAVYFILYLIALVVHLSVITRYLVAVVPTAIASTLVLLLIDNFTYTVFKFGISTSTGIGRAIYALIFIVIFIYSYLRALRFFGLVRKENSSAQLFNRLFYLAIGILVISTGLALTKFDFSKITSVSPTAGAQPATRLPNIILLGSDGVNADNMSVYGYARDTTPRIGELAQTSLVAENAFPNSSNTAGSIISIFTSKLPTQTRVLYAPDILTGINSFQHFPGLLKLEGYSEVEFGVPDYVDAFSLNLQYSFNTVNGRTQGYGTMIAYVRTLGYDNVAYFLYKLSGRAVDRIQHIFFIRDMQNPYNIVTQPVMAVSDEEKITQMLDVIEQSQAPVFVHVHLMGTHGPRFAPPVQVYSNGEQQDQGWMVDFYDDAILSFDHYVGEVIDRLKADGQFENTVLIIYSDHAMGYRVNARVPLIIHFPGDSYAGRITQNVQNMDIAPTVLNYMGLTEPGWMSGVSILNGPLDSHRLIFSTGTVKVAEDEQGVFSLDPQQIKPPFFQFSMMNVVDCQRWYQLDLSTFKWISGDIAGYSSPCSEASLFSFDEIKQSITQRLILDGFDVSSLP